MDDYTKRLFRRKLQNLIEFALVLIIGWILKTFTG